MATVNAMPIKRPTRTMTKSSRISLLEPLLYLRRRVGPPLPERLGKGHLEAFSAGHHDPEVVRDGGDEGVSVDASGNVTCSGTLAVNGAAITTDDTTFACFNTTTTVNAFGAATALRIGAATAAIGIGGASLGYLGMYR